MKRRDFLAVAGGTVLAAGVWTLGVAKLTAPRSRLPEGERKVDVARWGMVIDLDKCNACGSKACVEACHRNNNVGHFEDELYDIHWLRKVTIKDKEEEGAGEHAYARDILLLCNHCDHPPCAQVCPVQATYRRMDGIVMVDHHRCIGCRYCMVACPYNARQFNFKDHEEWPNKDYPKRSHGVAEACNLCAHLLDDAEEPHCLVACREMWAENGKPDTCAIVVGDLDDPTSDVSKLIADHTAKRIREDLGTEPKVYYLGL